MDSRSMARFSLTEQRQILASGTLRKSAVFLVIAFFVCSAALGYLVLQTKKLLSEQFIQYTATQKEEALARARVFPVGVDPRLKLITETTDIEGYYENQFSAVVQTEHTLSWFPKLLGKLALLNWYQNLASVSSRVLVIEPGERKEQIADHFGKILGWDETEKDTFLDLVVRTDPSIDEGKFLPGTYAVARGATPADVVPLVIDTFEAEVLSRYNTDVSRMVPLRDALIIASLLEREAYDFTDMRLISGVIWNRLFVDMRLQIDATLQYAKGSDPQQPWWPQVRPNDKYIASVYNTYKNSGLPPAPIANPSLDAILAALNPKKTDCMYYFHDKNGGFHCTSTYKEHVTLLKEYYGTGK